MGKAVNKAEQKGCRALNPLRRGKIPPRGNKMWQASEYGSRYSLFLKLPKGKVCLESLCAISLPLKK